MPTLDDLPTLAKRSLLTGKTPLQSLMSPLAEVPRFINFQPHSLAWVTPMLGALLIAMLPWKASTATAAVSVTLLSDIEDWIVREVSVVVTELFAGGSVSNLAMTVGITGDTDAYVDDVDCFTGTQFLRSKQALALFLTLLVQTTLTTST